MKRKRCTHTTNICNAGKEKKKTTDTYTDTDTDTRTLAARPVFVAFVEDWLARAVGARLAQRFFALVNNPAVVADAFHALLEFLRSVGSSGGINLFLQRRFKRTYNIIGGSCILYMEGGRGEDEDNITVSCNELRCCGNCDPLLLGDIKKTIMNSCCLPPTQGERRSFFCVREKNVVERAV